MVGAPGRHVPLVFSERGGADRSARVSLLRVLHSKPIYDIEDAREFLTTEGIDVDAIAPQVDGQFMSAFVRARRP